jgi:hypothetical protein
MTRASQLVVLVLQRRRDRGEQRAFIGSWTLGWPFDFRRNVDSNRNLLRKTNQQRSQATLITIAIRFDKRDQQIYI